MVNNSEGQKPYGDDFYKNQVDLSYTSARIYIDWLGKVHKPRTVADFGCGRGTWLRAFHEAGANRLVGFDGPWNRQEDMVDPAIDFRSGELNLAVNQGLGDERFDLAMSVEVAEHLLPENSQTVVDALCGLSDVVLFGSAFSHQPGTQHINTRPHSFWAKLFDANGYRVYDFFRAEMWGRKDVPFWYQQNSFLYVLDGHELNETLDTAGHHAMTRLEFMDCVHPDLLNFHVREPGFTRLDREIRSKLKRSLPAPLVSLARGMKKVTRIS